MSRSLFAHAAGPADAGVAATASGHAGHELLGLLAGAFIVGVGALVVGTVLAQKRGALSPARAVAFDDWTPLVAAGLSLGAAAIHVSAIGEHADRHVTHGIGFAAAALFQGLWALVYAVRPGRRLGLASLAVNAGIIGGWVASRTVGLPFGAGAWVPEPIGSLDIAATTLEAGLVAVLALRLAHGLERLKPRLAETSAVFYVGSSLLLVALVASLGFGLDAGHAHPDDVRSGVEAHAEDR